ncbi:hypothetical protein [Candidatus Burkholderia verschuerenii]|uniref:hypothetical protein n=1 Tax=Candidatus Burkholderia verschuerenii TaxID=242163 RepID=UPI0012ED707E|nr:hypothetical protein [Candidatus Burkholderia verschuerenii]
MSKDTVLIIEPNFSGHRWRYAEWAANAYMEAGYRCVIVTEPANASHSLVKRIQQQSGGDLDIELIEAPVHNGRGLSKVAYVRFHRDCRHYYVWPAKLNLPEWTRRRSLVQT